MNASWPLWRKISFRFFSIYFLLQIAPWTWFDRLPYLGMVTQFFNNYYYQFVNWAVTLANNNLFHIRAELIPQNGSGDTSFGWAEVSLWLLLAVVGAVAWSIIDRKREGYDRADYWVRTMLRYFLALHCLGYGILKIFALQMLFPTFSQMITPLGDFLPMRFSWTFIGYSTSYQIFSGAMETIAGLLLLNRKTVTLGLLFAGGVFANVFTMNLSYDIPVKIFSGQLFFYAIYLLIHDAPRLFSLLVLNKAVEGEKLYDFKYSSKPFRIGRLALKSLFIFMAVFWQIKSMMEYDRSIKSRPEIKPLTSGLYDVKKFVLNGDTIPALVTDTVRWKDMAIERGGSGSFGTTDTLFWQRYRRGYFSFKADTIRKTMRFIRRSWPGDTTYLFTMKYDIVDDKHIRMWTKVRNDSLYLEIERSKRHFQLSERQFHWLSEYNR